MQNALNVSDSNVSFFREADGLVLQNACVMQNERLNGLGGEVYFGPAALWFYCRRFKPRPAKAELDSLNSLAPLIV